MKVDIFGPETHPTGTCSNLRCPLTQNCMDMVNKTYKVNFNKKLQL